MKIAVLTTRTLRGSGFATRISQMVGAYASSGHDVDLFHYRFSHEQSPPISVESAVRRYAAMPLPKSRLRKHATLLPPMAWLCIQAHRMHRGSDAAKYDVVQAETSDTWGVARFFEAKKRLLVMHDDDESRLLQLAAVTPSFARRQTLRLAALKYGRWQLAAIRGADQTWFASRVDCNRLAQGIPRRKVSVVPNGAADELWSLPLPAEDDPPALVFVGPGFYPANAHGLRWFLREVWPLVKRVVPRARLRVVGIGWEGFDREAADVMFTGWFERLTDAYRGAAVVVAPVLAGGGTKIKVVEGMASGRPVVATAEAVQGIPRSAGVSVCTDAGTFARGVCAFLADPRQARRAGAANREAAEPLRWSSICRLAVAQLESLVMESS